VPRARRVAPPLRPSTHVVPTWFLPLPLEATVSPRAAGLVRWPSAGPDSSAAHDVRSAGPPSALRKLRSCRVSQTPPTARVVL